MIKTAFEVTTGLTRISRSRAVRMAHSKEEFELALSSLLRRGEQGEFLCTHEGAKIYLRILPSGHTAFYIGGYGDGSDVQRALARTSPQ